MTITNNHICRIRTISTHILTKRMTQRVLRQHLIELFQLTSSRRGWRSKNNRCKSWKSISTHILTKRMTMYLSRLMEVFWSFQLTSSRRGWRNDGRSCSWRIYFNSHPHEEDDGRHAGFCKEYSHFNSHPHEEDDFLGWICFLCSDISTHILTKRMTENWSQERVRLTYFNSHPHEEDDLKAGLLSLCLLLFQLTSSRRGWHTTNWAETEW